MRIAVCVKQVLYTGGHFEIDPGTGLACQKNTAPIFTVSRADRGALEEALRLRGESGGEVIAITVGPPRAAEALHTCLAGGADRGIHLLQDESMNTDAYGTALALSRAIAGLGCHLILCGTRSPDEGSSQTPPTLAERLNLPQVTCVIKIDLDAGGEKVRVVRRLERGKREVVECLLPAVIAVESAIREPRYISVRAHREAGQKKEVDVRPAFDGANEESSLTRRVGLALPRPRPKKMEQMDAGMSASDRLKFIMSGGVVQKEQKEGGPLTGPPEKMAGQIVEILKREGVIKLP